MATMTATTKATRYIGIDVHCEFCEGGATDSRGREFGQFKVATSIPTLLEVIEKVPRPRTVVIEEGPLADWLYRHLSPHVDEMIVCDPYRNALIALTSDPDQMRRIVRLELNGGGTAITRATTLEESVPGTVQTFVTISGDDLIYVESGPSASSTLAELVAYRVRLR